VTARSLVCGLDVGGTNVRGLAFDPAAPTEAGIERRVPTPYTATDLLSAIVGVVHGLAEAVEADGDEIGSAGLGIAGLVDRSGRLVFSPNLPGVHDEPLRDELMRELGLPVIVENDATAAAWGERVAGAGMDVDEMILITLGTGIGAGIVAAGNLVVGRNGFAGEAGHMVVDPAGPRCPCGRRGCWERFASGSGLGRLGREAALAGRLGSVVASLGNDPEQVRGEHLTKAAADGDPEALAVLEEFAWWVALGLANLTHILDTELIVIGGGLVSVGDLLLDPVRRSYVELLYASDRRVPARIEPAVLGEDAGAIGAGLLAAR
jgi:glucokinase